MKVSNALLRTLSNRRWNKPIDTSSLPVFKTTEKLSPLSERKIAKDCKNASTDVARRNVAHRFNAEAPQHSNQFVKASTTVLRDRRLTSTAKCLLLMIKALAGKSNAINLITKGQLAGAIGKSRRTVQYALHELQSLGYLCLETVKGYFGLYAGLKISLSLMTNIFSPAKFYQNAAMQVSKKEKPSFSDRQIAAQQITRFIYLEKKAVEIRLSEWLTAEN